jgi:hypothetical protein
MIGQRDARPTPTPPRTARTCRASISAVVVATRVESEGAVEEIRVLTCAPFTQQHLRFGVAGEKFGRSLRDLGPTLDPGGPRSGPVRGRRPAQRSPRSPRPRGRATIRRAFGSKATMRSPERGDEQSRPSASHARRSAPPCRPERGAELVGEPGRDGRAGAPPPPRPPGPRHRGRAVAVPAGRCDVGRSRTGLRSRPSATDLREGR